MTLEFDAIPSLIKAFEKSNSAAFARALDNEKSVRPENARSAAEYLIFRMFTKLETENPRPRAMKKMFVKTAEVLEELTPILIHDEWSREAMRRSLMVADAASELQHGIGHGAIQRALKVLNGTSPEMALENARRAGRIPLQP